MSNTPDEHRASAEAPPVRLPLQVGLSGLGQTTRYAALVWLGPGLLIAAAMFAPMFGLVARFLWILGVGGGGIAALVFALDAAESARRDRPSDVLLSATGLEVEGGAERSRVLSWTDVDAATCDVVAAEPRVALRWLVLSWLTLRKVPAISARVTVPLHRLRLPLRTGGDLVLAEAEEAERASLEALRDSIRSVATRPRDDAGRALPPEILRCAGCGAPQVPVDVDVAPCPFCGAPVRMPSELREKQRAAVERRADDAVSADLVKRLVSQPGALAADRSLWLGRKLLVLGQPFALVYWVVVLHRQTAAHPDANYLYVGRVSPSDDVVALYDLAVVALMLTLFFVGVWSVLSAYFEGRRALRVLAESFGAMPPPKPGAPSSCRECGAPLADGRGDVLVRCVYCLAENVLGVDPRPAAARHRTDRMDLEAAMAGRRRARTRLLVALPLCVALGALSVREVALLWWVPMLAPDTASCSGHCGKVENHDVVRRTVSFRDGERTERATVLPRGALLWDCSSCSVESGGPSVSAEGLSTDSPLVIQGGRMQPSPNR